MLSQEEIVYAVDYNPKNDVHLNRAALADFKWVLQGTLCLIASIIILLRVLSYCCQTSDSADHRCL